MENCVQEAPCIVDRDPPIMLFILPISAVSLNYQSINQYYAMLQCSKNLPIMLKIMLNIFASVPMFCYTLWIDNKRLSQVTKRSTYCNRTVIYLIAL